MRCRWQPKQDLHNFRHKTGEGTFPPAGKAWIRQDLVALDLHDPVSCCAAEGTGLFLRSVIGRRFPEITAAVTARIRSAALRPAASQIVFMLLAVLPAVFRRLRFGVWMG